jgi:eukaryotic-like serine/threonine-protein kinase
MDTGLLTNRYEIVRSLGSGAITAVLEGRDRQTGARVAIKVPIGRFKNDKTLLVRLEREVATLAGFHHPNVAAVHAVERHGETGFIVTELVDAPVLREVLAVRGRLSPARAARAATGICAALATAHARGIVHGHLTLDNVLMAGDGWVKVTDFRLAEAARPFARAPDPAIDLRALGRCLAAMLTGQEPAGRGPVLLGPEVPGELAAIVRQATANPPDAYSSAAELGRDLHNFLAAVPHSIPPAGERGAAMSQGAPLPTEARHPPGTTEARHPPGTEARHLPGTAPARHLPPGTAAAQDAPGAGGSIPATTAELVPVSIGSRQARGGRSAGVARQARRRRALAVCLVAAVLAVGGAVVAAQRLGGRPDTTGAGIAAPPLPTAGQTVTTGQTPTTTGRPTTTARAAAPVTAAPTTNSPTPTTAQSSPRRSVPRVTGLHRQEASSRLAQAGLKASVSLTPVNGAGRVDRVLSQQPAAGTVVPAGSVVKLVVGTRKPGG